MKEFIIKFLKKGTFRVTERQFLLKFKDIYAAIDFAEYIKKPNEGYEIQ